MPTTTRPRNAVLRRDSYAIERSAPALQSPFRSLQPSRRYLAALAMIETREQEIAALEAALAQATDPKAQKRLSQRLLATVNNLASWRDYLSGENEQGEEYYREKRAVIIPNASGSTKPVAKRA